MAIVRTVEWKLTCTPAEADAKIRQAFTKLDLTPTGDPGTIQGSAKRAIMRNRWSADVNVQLGPAPDGCVAVCRVSMPAGTKHYEVLDDVAEAVGDDLFDNRGLTEALQRLGRASRLFGRKELRHLRNLLHGTEHVVELGQGQYGSKMGIVVLTTERLFFLEKSLGSETLEQFDLPAITSLGVSKKVTGETLQIQAYSRVSEIKSMPHGQADAVSRAFRDVNVMTPQATTAQPSPAPAEDPITVLERLAALRDRGALSPEEFEAKKAELLRRL